MFTLTNTHPFELIYCQGRKKNINANSHVRLFIGFCLLLPFYYLHTKEKLSISLCSSLSNLLMLLGNAAVAVQYTRIFEPQEDILGTLKQLCSEGLYLFNID